MYKKELKAVILLMLLFTSGLVLPQTTNPTSEITKIGVVRLIQYNWHVSNSGSTDSCITAGYLSGKMVGVVTVPGVSSAAPSDDYDIIIKDDRGIDVMWGKGANRDSVNTEYIAGDSLGIIASSRLTICVYNAGSVGDSGVVYLYIQ